MRLWVTTSNRNLGKLIPLEVHGRLGNTNIANIYFPMSKWDMPYTVGKLKNTPIQYLVREIQP